MSIKKHTYIAVELYTPSTHDETVFIFYDTHTHTHTNAQYDDVHLICRRYKPSDGFFVMII